VQGANGKLQGKKSQTIFFSFVFLCQFPFLAFGFCEYENPEATLRCIRLLNGLQIQDKKLVVSDYIL
jgi:RNA recognition motif-containing protein